MHNIQAKSIKYDIYIDEAQFVPKSSRSNNSIVFKSKDLVNNFVSNLLAKSYIFSPKRFHAEQWAKIQSLLGDFQQQYDCLSAYKCFRSIQLFEDLAIWDTFICIIIILINFWNIFRIGGFSPENTFLQSLNVITQFLDMLVTINRSLIIEGVRVTDHKTIILYYIKTFFFLDLILLTWMVSFYVTSLHFVADLLFTIFFLVVRYRKLRFNKLYFIILALLVIHLSACLWHKVGMLDESGVSWLEQEGLNHDTPLSMRYHYSLYWAINQLHGIGTFKPTTQLELLISEITSLASMIGTSVVFYSLCHWKSKDQPLIQYMKKNKIKKELQQRILSYISETHKNEEYIEVLQQMGRLPKSLKNQVQLEVIGNLIKNCTFLKYFMSSDKLIDCLEEVRYSPDEVIEDHYNDTSLYIISDGEIQVEDFHILKPGDSFGEHSFFTGEPSKIKIVSRLSCHLFILKRDDFLDIISTSSSDYEVFSFIKDKIALYNEFDIINMKCYYCLSNVHLCRNCPVLHYQPDYERVIKKHQFSPSLARQKQCNVHQYISKVIRVQKRKKNSLAKNIEFQKRMVELQQLYADNLSSFNELSGSQLPYDDQIIRESYNSASSLSKQSKSQGLVQNSFLKEKSTYEQNSFPTAHEGLLFYQPEYDQEYDIPQVLMKDSQFIDQNNEEFINLTRKNDVKRTFATAGFGQQSIGQSMKQSLSPVDMQIIQEKDSDELGSHSNEASNEEIKDNGMKTKSPIHRKNNEPKLTFNYQLAQTDQLSSRQNSMQSRQGSRSSRSMTYTPLISQASVSHRSISNNQKNSSLIRGKTSYQTISGNSAIQTKNIEEQSLHRKNTRNRSNYTKVSIVQSNFSPFSGLEVKFQTIHLIESNIWQF